MKIVVNAYSARIGGGQTYLRNLFDYLPTHAELEVFVFAPQGLKLPTHPNVRRVSTTWPTRNPLARAFWERFVLPHYLRQVNADVLFCPGGVVATRVPRGCRVVTMFRNMIPFDAALVSSMPWGLQKLRNLILARVMLRSMAEADLTIFISDHARGIIEGRRRIPHAVTIPHGISTTFRPTAVELPRPTRLPVGDYLFYVSRFDIYKHHFQVVQAFAAVRRSLGPFARLVLAGEDDLPEARRVREQIELLGLQDEVILLGAVLYEELPAFYRHARAIIFASSCENCPNILLESLGAGRPVLCSDVMPMPEFGGEGLVYFSPTDPETLASALLRVLQDESMANAVGQYARERSIRYDWAYTGQETWSHILDLAAQEKSS